jgi:hypothetical protein
MNDDGSECVILIAAGNWVYRLPRATAEKIDSAFRELGDSL